MIVIRSRKDNEVLSLSCSRELCLHVFEGNICLSVIIDGPVSLSGQLPSEEGARGKEEQGASIIRA